jgi:hypothetical protein
MSAVMPQSDSPEAQVGMGARIPPRNTIACLGSHLSVQELHCMERYGRRCAPMRQSAASCPACLGRA